MWSLFVKLIFLYFFQFFIFKNPFVIVTRRSFQISGEVSNFVVFTLLLSRFSIFNSVYYWIYHYLKSLASAQHTREFNTPVNSTHPSVQHTLQFNTPFSSTQNFSAIGHLCWTEGSLRWTEGSLCWTEGSLCWTDAFYEIVTVSRYKRFFDRYISPFQSLNFFWPFPPPSAPRWC